MEVTDTGGREDPHIKPRNGKWKLEMRTLAQSRAPKQKIWVGTYSSRNEAVWARDVTLYLMDRRDYDAVHFGNFKFQKHKEMGGEFKQFVKGEASRYVEFRRHDVGRYLSRLPGEHEAWSLSTANEAFAIVSEELKVEKWLIGHSEQYTVEDRAIIGGLALDAAALLMKRKDYDPVHFENYMFPTHQERGGTFKEFVVCESRRYAVLHVARLLDKLLCDHIETLDSSKLIIYDKIEETGEGSPEVRNDNSLAASVVDGREASRYVEFRRHDVSRYLSRLPGEHEAWSLTTANEAFAIVSEELKVEKWLYGHSVVYTAEDRAVIGGWALDAAALLMKRKDYDPVHFKNHKFWTHQELGGTFKEFVVLESRRYAVVQELRQLDKFQCYQLETLDSSNLIIFDQVEETGEGSPEVRNDNSIAAFVVDGREATT